jgi:radical SAM superfamily enzyme YgiQ (UPF0313 family)
VRVLLISVYELGHQPLHVASPAARLLEAGHDVQCLDLSISPFNCEELQWAERVAISVPMHTAMRLALEVVDAISRVLPDLPICLYGLYAGLVTTKAVDRIIGGEYEQMLVDWAQGGTSGVSVDLSRQSFLLPHRDLLPPLDSYAHLMIGDEHRTVGYVEASHGCRHRCGHCPIPALYDGIFRIVGLEAVVADVDQLVTMGARHITLGDPDFLNGPAHSLRVIHALHERHPTLTFDVTIKVEHLVDRSDLLVELAECGVIFIVSAFESTNDHILEILDKGHTSDEMAVAVRLVRAAGMEIRPTFLPFTPWTKLSDILDLFAFLEKWNLDVDPIQMTIRLLVPKGSLLLETAGALLEPYEPQLLAHRWTSELDALQEEFAAIVENLDSDPLSHMFRAAAAMAGISIRNLEIEVDEGRPRLTEPWFC